MTKVLVVFVFALSTVATACERAPGPEFQITEFYGSIKAQNPAAMRHAYRNLLSEATRDGLQRHADHLSGESGGTIQPWDVLIFQQLLRGDRISKQEIVEQTSDTARVKVHFAWYVPATDAEAKYRRPSPSPALVSLVKEGGQWRIHLPELVAALGP